MIIKKVEPLADNILEITSKKGLIGFFDVRPYLDCETFILNFAVNKKS